MDDGAMSMEPVYGGEVSYLLEAESDTWDIPGANCAVSCITVMRSVAEPMAIANDQGIAEPYVLESIESSDDFSEWTLTMRDGVMFHDGTMADGAAVQRNLVEMASGLLQGQVFLDLVDGTNSIELVDDMTVKVTFDKPFATFSSNLADRTGYLMAPAFWDDPERAAAMPIGTGPFQMVEWTRDEVTRVEKFDGYWRTDPNGNALPYLDAINFRPNPDVSARRATMEAGDADINMDSFGENGDFWEGEWLDNGGGLVEMPEARKTTYLMYNNAAAPFDNADFRRAIALCTNRDDYLFFRAPGEELANGPFPDASGAFDGDTGFPEFDPDAGNALLDEIGRPEVLTYGTTNVPSNRETAEFFQDQWSTNCGLNVEIDQFDQSELITKAITGQFEVFLWRNHGQGHPGLELVWWHSRHASGLALNFGRIIDDRMDELMLESWTTNDPAELSKISGEINELFGEQVYNLWLNVSSFRVVHQGDVHNVGVIHTPSGGMALPSLAGRTWLGEVWRG